jgi:hypothetical protein
VPKLPTGRVKSRAEMRSRRQEAPDDLRVTLKFLVIPADIMPTDSVIEYLANKLSQLYDIYPKNRSQLLKDIGRAKRDHIRAIKQVNEAEATNQGGDHGGVPES